MILPQRTLKYELRHALAALMKLKLPDYSNDEEDYVFHVFLSIIRADWDWVAYFIKYFNQKCENYSIEETEEYPGQKFFGDKYFHIKDVQGAIVKKVIVSKTFPAIRFFD